MNKTLLESTLESAWALPPAAERIVALAASDRADASDLAAAIAADGELDRRLFEYFNSEFCRRGRVTVSIGRAIALLGMDTVSHLAIAFSVSAHLADRPCGDLDISAHWRRAVYAATAARLVAARAKHSSPETAFAFALLMDIGALALAASAGPAYAELVRCLPSHGGLAASEERVFKLTHAHVSEALAAHWRIPGALAAPMGLHHGAPKSAQISAATKTLAHVGEIAGRCADGFVDGDPLWAIADVRRLMDMRLGWSASAGEDVMRAVGQQAPAMATLLHIDIGPRQGYGAPLSRARAQLERIAAKQSSEPERGVERRRAPRIERFSKIVILPCDGQKVMASVAAQLRDLSARGIGLLMDRPLPLGSQFIFQTTRGDGSTLTLLYDVIRVGSSSGQHRVGARLVKTLDTASQAVA